MKKTTASNLKFSAVTSVMVTFLGMMYLFTGKIAIVIVLSISMMLISAVVAGYYYLSKWLEKRKLRKAGATTDGEGPKDPDKAKAKLDDLRKSFYNGLQQFSEAGRDIYELPWFLMVGLSGVGKTESIRHSGLNFPPNLQDESQGKGGTRTLSWWFTKEAVILDTIGEWLLEEDGELSEWMEFFKLLKTHRPQCPFNGIILSISAESLLLDTDAKIKEKAGKIAKKLDVVQRLLELRFPVFIMITKSDLITGFREYFDEDLDPSIRSQMVGWSNPLELDEPFAYSKLENNLNQVFESLKKQRLNLLLPEEEGSPKRKADLLFRLFAFPDNLLRLLPKLRVYLDSIFLAGEWSAKPLFFRGLYFTSAKQDGWELDTELAESFNIPDASRIEERNPGGHHAHFLTELYNEKIFQEKGLVLRAASAKSYQRKKLLLTWGTSFLILIAFILLTVLSFNQLKEAIGLEQNYWAQAAEKNQWQEEDGTVSFRPLVQKVTLKGRTAYRYAGTEPLVEGEKKTLGEFVAELATLTRKPIDIPWIFSMSAGLQGDLARDRALAGQALFESSLMVPLVDAARNKLAIQKADLWTPAATGALAQLIRLDAAKRLGPDKIGEGALLDLDALFDYVLEETPADLEGYRQHHAKLIVQAFDAVYTENKDAWPPPSLSAGTKHAEQILERARTQFLLHWIRQIEEQKVNPYLSDIALLTESGTLFRKAESRLLDVDRTFVTETSLPATLLTHNRLAGDWEKEYASLSEAGELIKKYEGILATGTLETAYDTQGAKAVEEMEESFAVLLTQLKTAAGGGEAGKDKGDPFLGELDLSFKDKLGELKATFLTGKIRQEIQLLDKEVYKIVRVSDVGRGADRAYKERFKIYKLAHEQLTGRLATPEIFDLAQVFTKSKEDMIATRDRLTNQLAPLTAPTPRFKEMRGAAHFALNLAERVQVYAMIKSGLDNLRNAGTHFNERVTKHAKIFEPIQRVKILLTHSSQGTPTFEGTYHPEVMRKLLRTRETLNTLLGNPDKAQDKPKKKVLESLTLAREYKDVNAAFKAYFDAYARYWINVVREGFKVREFSWDEFVEQLGKLSQWEVNTMLSGTLNVVEDALKDPNLPLSPALAEDLENLRATIQGGRERLKAAGGEDNPFVQKCKSVVTAWGGFKGGAPESVRLALLELTPESLKEKYVIMGTEGARDVVVRFWEELTYQAIGSLGRSFQKKGAKELDRLPTYQAFPFTRLGDDGKTLTVKEVAEARLLLDRMRPNPATLSAEAVGSGASTGVEKLDQIIQHLAWLKMPEKTEAWIRGVDLVLAGLPAPDTDPYSCEFIQLARVDQQDRAEKTGKSFEVISALTIWRSIELLQGGITAARRQVTNPQEETALGSVEYPGKPVQVALYRAPSDRNPDKIVKVDNPWGPLSLLHMTRADRDKKDPLLWTGMLILKDAKGFERRLWFKLKFAKELPALENWPAR